MNVKDGNAFKSRHDYIYFGRDRDFKQQRDTEGPSSVMLISFVGRDRCTQRLIYPTHDLSRRLLQPSCYMQYTYRPSRGRRPTLCDVPFDRRFRHLAPSRLVQSTSKHVDLQIITNNSQIIRKLFANYRHCLSRGRLD